MDWTLEVVVLPVSDIDRSVAFYRDQVGFALDHDTRNEHMHVVQLTPTGSGCSIVIGDLPSQNEMAPGSVRGLQLGRVSQPHLGSRPVASRPASLSFVPRRTPLRGTPTPSRIGRHEPLPDRERVMRHGLAGRQCACSCGS